MRALAIILISAITVSAAQAADMPKQGEDAYTIDYVVTSTKSIKAGDATVTLLEFAGISRNDKGAGMFHNFGAHCLGMRQAIGTNIVSRGTCIDADPDGDQIFSTFEARATEGKPFAGTHEFIGGTGKYAGFTGKADYTIQAIKSPAGTGMFSVPHKAKWQILAASEPGAIAQSSTALSQTAGGTAAEAKAMLVKAVAAVKADKAKALDMFNKGEGGFLDRDLYVFCDNLSDGKVVALGNPNAKQLFGQDIREHKDSVGKAYGMEIYAGGQKPEGQFTEVSYMFPRPGADKTPVAKISLVTNAGDLGCGVGYYKQ